MRVLSCKFRNFTNLGLDNNLDFWSKICYTIVVDKSTTGGPHETAPNNTIIDTHAAIHTTRSTRIYHHEQKSCHPRGIPKSEPLSRSVRNFHTSISRRSAAIHTTWTHSPNQGPIVFVFLATECPVAQRYAMRLKRLHTEFTGETYTTLVAVYANENDTVDDIEAYVAKAAYPFPVVKDTTGRLARALGATDDPTSCRH